MITERQLIWKKDIVKQESNIISVGVTAVRRTCQKKNAKYLDGTGITCPDKRKYLFYLPGLFQF